ncbi:hypothetical protein [Gordonia sp. HS-NH1]|uniref:hypothetical protein n=1 Tax=Gordonia sp. HS-NH1 TaxID=1435068 RepID=UPI000A99D7DE|nr:hypothetical protein [Gordonia sp. HS-NH1]
MALTTSRPDDPPAFFPSWAEYIKRWRGGTDETFCRAIAAIYDPVVRAGFDSLTQKITKVSTVDASEAERDELRAGFVADREKAKTRLGFPWITPVLGSGCLSLAETSAAPTIEAVPTLLAGVSREWGYLPDGTAVPDAVERFALSLVDSKLGRAAADRAAKFDSEIEVAETETTEIAARAILCARLLTRLYFEAGTLTEGAVTNYNGTLEFSTELLGPTPCGAELADLLVVPLSQQLRILQKEIGSRDEELAFVADFAAAVLKDLSGAEGKASVTGSDAILMAEVAWHFMTEGTSQYPGWSDLLTQLTLASESAERSHRWPHLDNLSAARERLHAQIIQTTIDSWASRVGSVRPCGTGTPTSGVDAPSVRDDLYDAVAELLIAQAKLHSQTASERVDQLPPAVAFVTSFDLELEMALMAARVPFRLVVPFYVGPSDTPNARAFVWLQTIISVPSAKDQLTHEDLYRLRVTRDWVLLTSQPDPNLDDFSMPIVVRVAGSPLIKVDAIDDLDDDEKPFASKAGTTASWVMSLKESLGGPAMTLAGTVLLDEYTALHQWAAELAQPPIIDNEKHDERLGLPERLFKGGTDDDARFWFVLGVQLSDEAVRQRTAAVVGTADLRSHVSRGPRSTLRAGVVVNRRTTPNERDVFLWQGLDVVAATYDRVVPAIRHMAAHTSTPKLRRLKGGVCEMEGGPV